MSGKKMEGNEEQKRKKAREAREEGKTPSEEQATSGSSKQRLHKGEDAGHAEKIDSIRKGKQDILTENTPEPRPGSRNRDD